VLQWTCDSLWLMYRSWSPCSTDGGRGWVGTWLRKVNGKWIRPSPGSPGIWRSDSASHGRNSGYLSLPILGWAVKVRLDADVAPTPVALWPRWWE
jgi:hypothetical protein